MKKYAVAKVKMGERKGSRAEGKNVESIRLRRD